MKNMRKTLKLSLITIKLQPFFLFYGLSESLISIVSMLLPIGIVEVIVGYYEADPRVDFIWVVAACSGFALAHYLINCYYFLMGRLYGKNRRSFAAKFNIIIYNKLKEIDYEMYQTTEFLNDYNRALDDGPDACVGCFWTLSDVVTRILTVGVIFAIFATLDPFIILYAVGTGIIFFFLGKYNSRVTWNLSEKQKQHYRERGYIRRLFYLKDSAQDIRCSNVKDLFLDINDSVGDKVIRNSDKYQSKTATISFLANLLVRTVYPFSLAFLANITLQTHDYVTFTALIVAAGSLSNYVMGLSDSLAGFVTRAVQGEAIHKVLDRKGVIEISGSKAAEDFKEIRVSQATFSYQEKLALKDISFSIKKGEKIAIVGENGAGKTTLVKLLLRLYDPNDGTISLNGEDYKDLYPDSIRKKIGAVFQDFEIYAFTIGENVLMRKVKTQEDEDKVIEALQFSGLYEKVKSLEKGIHTNVTKEFDEQGVEFSGGERQKLVIARAYAGDYDLIILDEPNSALDPLAEAEIYEKMMKLGKNRTLVFISHRLSSTISADKIYLFEEGRIAESGTHRELMAIENGKYKYMFEIQAQNYIEGSRSSEV